MYICLEIDVSFEWKTIKGLALSLEKTDSPSFSSHWLPAFLIQGWVL